MNNDIPQTIHWQFLRQGTTGPVIRLVPMDQRLTIVEDEASITSELTLQRVILLDAGTYTCVTSNPTQLSIQANDSATLTVEGNFISKLKFVRPKVVGYKYSLAQLHVHVHVHVATCS